jgi:ABC-type transport system substrate-binding protein
VAEFLQNSWREAGIQVDVQPAVQFAALQDLLVKGDYDAIIVGWVSLSDPVRVLVRQSRPGQHDYAVSQGGVLVVAVLFSGINLLVDLAYAYLNPRIRYGS